MADKKLTQDYSDAELLLQELEDLKVNRGFREYLARLARLKSRDQELLEAARDPMEVFRFQGRLGAFNEASKCLDVLIEGVAKEKLDYQTGVKPRE